MEKRNHALFSTLCDEPEVRRRLGLVRNAMPATVVYASDRTGWKGTDEALGISPDDLPPNWLPAGPIRWPPLWFKAETPYLAAWATLRDARAANADFVWWIEYDVLFDNWSELAEAASGNDADLLCVHPKNRRDHPDWYWFGQLPTSHARWDRGLLLPVVRLSRRAMDWLLADAEANREVFCELAAANCIAGHGGTIGDFRSLPGFSTLYDSKTLQWRDRGWPLNPGGRMWHPVKPPSFSKPKWFAPGEIRKAKLCAGSPGLDGWLNLGDPAGTCWKHACDLKKPLPFAENTFDFLFLDRVFGGFGTREKSRLLGECFRVLRPAGALRLDVPDRNPPAPPDGNTPPETEPQPRQLLEAAGFSQITPLSAPARSRFPHATPRQPGDGILSLEAVKPRTEP